MFSSDQRFLISGDKKENLEIALRCALELEGSLYHKSIKGATGVGSFCVHDRYGLVLGDIYGTEYDKEFSKYPMAVNLEMLVEHIWQYLGSAEAEVLRNQQKSLEGDSTPCKGWEIYIPDWAYFRSIVAIRPSWTYYAK